MKRESDTLSAMCLLSQGVSGRSPGGDGLPVVAAEGDQEELPTGEERGGRSVFKICVYVSMKMFVSFSGKGNRGISSDLASTFAWIQGLNGFDSCGERVKGQDHCDPLNFRRCVPSNLRTRVYCSDV